MLSQPLFDLLFLLYLVFRFFEKIFGLGLLGVDKSFVLIYGICFDLLLAVLLHSRKVLCILELLARFADNILEITNQECLIFLGYICFLCNTDLDRKTTGLLTTHFFFRDDQLSFCQD